MREVPFGIAVRRLMADARLLTFFGLRASLARAARAGRHRYFIIEVYDNARVTLLTLP